jgi:hypothetical protein
MGHSDIAASTEKWNKRKAKVREILGNAPKDQAPKELDVLQAPEYDSRLKREVANRLDGRPTPSRIELLKLTIDQARDLARRR